MKDVKMVLTFTKDGKNGTAVQEFKNVHQLLKYVKEKGGFKMFNYKRDDGQCSYAIYTQDDQYQARRALFTHQWVWDKIETVEKSAKK